MQLPASSKALLDLLSDGGFHSGTELARRLGLSRTSIWGLIHELERLGLEVNAVPGRGYRLGRPLELLDEAMIRSALSEASLAALARLEVHDQLDSTNTHLMNQIAAGAPGGTVCLAEYQSAGRGRVGRQWRSPFAGNIGLSLLWRFDEQAAVAGLSLAVGVAVIRALRRLGLEGVGLKWPNDLLWQGSKLGGILLEVSGEVHGGCAVVIGIGLNVHIPSAAAKAIDQVWTDLNRISGDSPPSRNRLVAALIDELLSLLADYPEQGLRTHIEEWRQWHCMNGRRVSLQIGDRSIRGSVAGISDQGLLVLDCDEGGLREFASGDMRLRLDE